MGKKERGNSLCGSGRLKTSNTREGQTCNIRSTRSSDWTCSNNPNGAIAAYPRPITVSNASQTPIAKRKCGTGIIFRHQHFRRLHSPRQCLFLLPATGCTIGNRIIRSALRTVGENRRPEAADDSDDSERFRELALFKIQRHLVTLTEEMKPLRQEMKLLRQEIRWNLCRRPRWKLLSSRFMQKTRGAGGAVRRCRRGALSGVEPGGARPAVWPRRITRSGRVPRSTPTPRSASVSGSQPSLVVPYAYLSHEPRKVAPSAIRAPLRWGHREDGGARQLRCFSGREVQNAFRSYQGEGGQSNFALADHQKPFSAGGALRSR